MLRLVHNIQSTYSASVSRIKLVANHLSMQNNTTNHLSGVTAGIIIIGDEILKGQVQDTNTHFLCQRLFSLGVQVKRVSVIGDELDGIAQEIKQFSDQYTHVITSGGIGPTHDDVTFEGVATAFGETVHFHPDLVAVCKEFFGTDDLASPKLKLAKVPLSAKLIYGNIISNSGEKKKARYPVVNVKNVYVLPGVPSLMERAFGMLEELFRDPSHQRHVQEMFIKRDEMSVTSILNSAVHKFKQDVVFGSYPDFHNSYYKVKLTMESQNPSSVSQAYDYIQRQLPKDSIVDYDMYPILDANIRVYALTEDKNVELHLREKLKNTLSCIEEALEKYNEEELCVGFNGGKDCTALLHLTYAVIKKKYPTKYTRLKVLYIRRGQPFPELEIFIKKSVENYDLNVVSIYGRIKDALTEMKSLHPSVQAVVMGTRSTDPYSSHLQSFCMTDEDWPQYMRVNPILNWTYTDVWTFIRKLNIPYCSLYDNGYTSLGSLENTHPNPELQQVDERGIITYRPAHLLLDGHSERAGRN